MRFPSLTMCFTMYMAFSCSYNSLPAASKSPAPQPILMLAHPDGIYNEALLPTTKGNKTNNLRKPNSRGIAGLQLGISAGPFRIDALQVRLSATLTDKDYCVRITTNDGRYWSLNSYFRSPSASTAPIIQTKSRMTSRLADEYKASEVLVRIVATATCGEDASGALVPLLSQGSNSTSDKSLLTVYVNAPGDQVQVWIDSVNGQRIVDGLCTADASDAITFTERCEIALTDQARQPGAKLVLNRIGSGFRAPQRFDLQMPK